jgi:hypothetical protein
VRLVNHGGGDLPGEALSDEAAAQDPTIVRRFYKSPKTLQPATRDLSNQHRMEKVDTYIAQQQPGTKVEEISRTRDRPEFGKAYGIARQRPGTGLEPAKCHLLLGGLFLPPNRERTPMHPPFEPGHSYSKGRVRGSKNKLASTVYADTLAIWTRNPADKSLPETQGQDALQKMYKFRPADFVKATLSILPKDFVVENILADYRQEEIELMIIELRKQIAEGEQPLMIEHEKVPEDANR